MTTYRDVKAAILARIVSREWPPGALIPSEEDLARAHGCARATANRALRELAESGIVERRRKAGTRVALRSARGAVFDIPVVRVEIERAGKRYGYRRLARAEHAADDALIGRLDVATGAPALFVRCLHLADGEPYQLEHRWISLDAAPAARAESFAHISPNEWLVREIPYSRAEHAFSAATPEQTERDLLRLGADEPVFVIERRTWLGAAPVTYVRLSHPGARYRMVSRLGDAAA